MNLEWTEQAPGWSLASGEHEQYMIVQDDWNVVLTRFYLDAHRFEAARQAALNALPLRALREIPQTTGAATWHLKQVAQKYEAGIDTELAGWRH